MRKVALGIASTLLVVVFLAVAFTGCAPILRKQMREYFSNESVYVFVQGEVTRIEDNNYVLVLLRDEEAPLDWNGRTVSFLVHTDTKIEELLSVGDIIFFHTATFMFYSGYTRPIVSIEKDGETCLSLEEGKENLFEFIETVDLSIF